MNSKVHFKMGNSVELEASEGILPPTTPSVATRSLLQNLQLEDSNENDEFMSIGGAGLEIGESSQVFEDADKKMLPCRYFLKGYCAKDTECIYYHPSPEDLASAIASPPFPEGFGTDGIIVSLVTDRGRGMFPDGGRRYQRSSLPPLEERTNRPRFQGRSLPTRFPSPFHYGQQLRPRQSSLDRSFGQRPQRPKPTIRIPQFVEGGHSSQVRHYVQNYLQPVAQSHQMQNGGLDYYEYDDGGNMCLFEEQLSQPVLQETLFKHIEWTQFLAPGQLPPPLVALPILEVPYRKPGRNFLAEMTAPPSEEEVRSAVANGYASGSSCGDGVPEYQIPGKMTPKEELHFKLKQIASKMSGNQEMNDDDGFMKVPNGGNQPMVAADPQHLLQV